MTYGRKLPMTQWSKINEIEGWLAYSAADLSWRLITAQAQRGYVGSILEFGVFRGKYLSLMYAASEETGVKVTGVDGFFAGYGVPLEDEWVHHARSVMRGNVEMVSGDTSRLEIVHANTNSLSDGDLETITGSNLQFVSIDAGHDCEDVVNDLNLVVPLLHPSGIIAADDVFNPVVPGVSEGLVRFLLSPAGSGVQAFAHCGNKMFLCHPATHPEYTALVRQIAATGAEAYLRMSAAHHQENAGIGFVPKFFGAELVPFLNADASLENLST